VRARRSQPREREKAREAEASRPLHDLEGFWSGADRTIHITFENADTFVIDIYRYYRVGEEDDREDIDVIGRPIVVNVGTGTAYYESMKNWVTVFYRLKTFRRPTAHVRSENTRTKRSRRNGSPG